MCLLDLPYMISLTCRIFKSVCKDIHYLIRTTKRLLCIVRFWISTFTLWLRPIFWHIPRVQFYISIWFDHSVAHSFWALYFLLTDFLPISQFIPFVCFILFLYVSSSWVWYNLGLTVLLHHVVEFHLVEVEHLSLHWLSITWDN